MSKQIKSGRSASAASVLLTSIKGCRCAGTNENCCFCSGSGKLFGATTSGTKYTRPSPRRKNSNSRPVKIGTTQYPISKTHSIFDGEKIIRVPTRELSVAERLEAGLIERGILVRVGLIVRKPTDSEKKKILKNLDADATTCVRHPKNTATEKTGSNRGKENTNANLTALEVAFKDAAKTGAVKTRESITGTDSIDGSRHIGFVIRESGRFGSHPKYDPMDDESFA